MKNRITEKELIDLEAKLNTLKQNGFSITMISKAAGWNTRKLNRVIEGGSVIVNDEMYQAIVKYYHRCPVD